MLFRKLNVSKKSEFRPIFYEILSFEQTKFSTQILNFEQTIVDL